jgi:GDP-4-dehydro-6-deoxy-D-mannose reductase
MKQGKSNRLLVGNIRVSRDFTDVRDVVEGYQRILNKGKAGEIYNLGSGRIFPLPAVIRQLEKLSGCKAKIVSSLKSRPLDIPAMRANIQKIRKTVGWQPRYSFQETLREIYLFYKGRVTTADRFSFRATSLSKS